MDLLNKISAAFFWAGIPNTATPGQYVYFKDEKGDLIFSCSTRTDQPSSDIDNFDIGAKWKGQKLSTIALTAIAQHFESAGAQYININTIRHDGLSYWPRFGAIPSHGVPSAHYYLPPFIEEEFVSSDESILREASRLAKINPEDAWFFITDPKTQASRNMIERLNLGSKSSTMHMELEHPIIRERLGLNSS